MSYAITIKRVKRDGTLESELRARVQAKMADVLRDEVAALRTSTLANKEGTGAVSSLVRSLGHEHDYVQEELRGVGDHVAVRLSAQLDASVRGAVAVIAGMADDVALVTVQLGGHVGHEPTSDRVRDELTSVHVWAVDIGR